MQLCIGILYYGDCWSTSFEMKEIKCRNSILFCASCAIQPLLMIRYAVGTNHFVMSWHWLIVPLEALKTEPMEDSSHYPPTLKH